MFGIGPQELLIIGLLALLVFGPIKAAGMARDFGRFVSEARSTVDEFKNELVPEEEVNEVRHTVDELRGELASYKKDLNEHAEYGTSRASQRQPQAPQTNSARSSSSSSDEHSPGE